MHIGKKSVGFAIGFASIVGAMLVGCKTTFYKDEASMVALAQTVGKATAYTMTISENFTKNGAVAVEKVTSGLKLVIDNLPADLTSTNAVGSIKTALDKYVLSGVEDASLKATLEATVEVAGSILTIGMNYIESKNPTLMANSQCVYNVVKAYLDAVYSTLSGKTSAAPLFKGAAERKIFEDILELNGIVE